MVLECPHSRSQSHSRPKETRALGTRLIFINLQLILLNSILFIERLGLIVSVVLKGKS